MSLYKPVTLLVAYFIIASLFIGFVVYEKENARVDAIISAPSEYITSSIPFGEAPFYQLVDMGLLGRWDDNLVFQGSGLGNLLPQSDVMFRNILPDEGTYMVNYTITRGDTDEFELWIRASEVGTSYSVRYKDGMLYAPRRNSLTDLPMTSGHYFETAVSLPPTFTITTIYHPPSDMMKLSLDGMVIGQWKGDHPISGVNPTHYGGIGAWGTAGLRVDSVETLVMIRDGVDKDEPVNFLSLMLSLLIWNVDDEYFPWWANILFIKLPGLFVVIAIAMWVRAS